MEFDGGSISASGNNNTITGDNTGIIGYLNNIFSLDISLVGTYNIKQFIPEMFKTIAGQDSNAINKAIDFAVNTNVRRVILCNKTYHLYNSITIPASIYFGGEYDTTMTHYNSSYPQLDVRDDFPAIVIHETQGGDLSGVNIGNIHIYGNDKGTSTYGIYVNTSNLFLNCKLTNIFIQQCEAGIRFDSSSGIGNNIFENIKIQSCRIGFAIYGNSSSTWMNGNLFLKCMFLLCKKTGILLNEMASIQTNTYINCDISSVGYKVSEEDAADGVSAYKATCTNGLNSNRFIDCYFEDICPRPDGTNPFSGYLDNDSNAVFNLNNTGVVVENCIISSFVNVYYVQYKGTIVSRNNFLGVYLGEGYTGLLTIFNPIEPFKHSYIFEEYGGTANNLGINRIIKNIKAYDGGIMAQYQYANILISGGFGYSDGYDKEQNFNIQPYKIGPTNARPTSKIAKGTCYFDEGLGKPIWWIVNNTNPNGTWVDATGTSV